MTKTQVEVITLVQRRRGWSRAEKERIVAAAMEPGAVASEVARAAGIHTSRLFRWRQQLCDRTQVPAASNPFFLENGSTAESLTLPAGIGHRQAIKLPRICVCCEIALKTKRAPHRHMLSNCPFGEGSDLGRSVRGLSEERGGWGCCIRAQDPIPTGRE